MPLTLFSDALPTATLSGCERYRFTLTRTWDPSRPVLAWCMLNPSKADAERDDPTIRRVRKFSRSWGFGGAVVVNLFAYRATNPMELSGMGRDAIAPPGEAGEHPLHDNVNDAHILHATDGKRLIAAWGLGGGYLGRAAHVMGLLRNRRVECLGMNSDGSPRHPLYLPASTAAVPYEMEAPCP